MSWAKHTPMSVRFWKYVRKTDTCWLWIGAQMGRGWDTKTGYGLIQPDWPATKNIPAHRAAWLLHNGAIPEGVLVLHKCDVRPCVNPAHLFLGTPQDNTRDMLSKGRKGKTGKLTHNNVRAIRAASSRGIKHHHLARYFGVTRCQINRIVNYKSQRDVV